MSKRDEYLEKIKARFDQWDAEIARLQAKSDEAEADAKIEYQKQLEDLRGQRDEAEAQLKEMQATSEDAWNDLEKGFAKAWDAISDSFEKAASRYQ